MRAYLKNSSIEIASMIWVIIFFVGGGSIYDWTTLFLESEDGEFWKEVIIYAFAVVLATVMPICTFWMALKHPTKDGAIFWVSAPVITFLSYPLIAHAIMTVSDTGLDIALFKESVKAAAGFGNGESSLYGLWYSGSVFVYGMTSAVISLLMLMMGYFCAFLVGWALTAKGLRFLGGEN